MTAVRTFLLLSVLGVVLLVAAAPAAAHTRLVGTAPEADATVTEEVTHVLLEFSQPVNQTIGEIVVHAPDGTAVTDGDVHIDEARVEQRLSDLSETGSYTVSYRVVASDGHPLTGTFHFVYDGPVTADEPEPPPSTTPDEPEPEPPPTATPDGSVAPSAEPREPPGAEASVPPDVESPERPEADPDETELAAPPAGERRDGSGQAATAAVVADPMAWLLLGITAAVVLGLLVAAARAVRHLVRWQPET